MVGFDAGKVQTTASENTFVGAGKSAFVLFHHVNSSVQYEDLAIWLLHLNPVYLYLIDFGSHMY